MKKYIVTVLVMVLCGIMYASTPSPVNIETPAIGWKIIGTSSATGSEPNDPNYLERNYNTFIAVSKVIVWTRPAYINNPVFRFSAKSEGTSDTVWQMYAAWSDSTDSTDNIRFMKIATLTLNTGKQTAVTSTYEFADAIAITNEYWLSDINDVSPGSDGIALLHLEAWNSKYIGFVPTTLGSDAQIEAIGGY